MNKYVYPFEQDGQTHPGMSVRDYIATEVLKGLVANPNLIDTTNVIRASQDAAGTVQRDEANHDYRLVNFARILAERMIDELEAVKA
jgi:hypothetical protein